MFYFFLEELQPFETAACRKWKFVTAKTVLHVYSDLRIIVFNYLPLFTFLPLVAFIC